MKENFYFNMKMNQEYEKEKNKYDKMIDDINRLFLKEYKKDSRIIIFHIII